MNCHTIFKIIPKLYCKNCKNSISCAIKKPLRLVKDGRVNWTICDECGAHNNYDDIIDEYLIINSSDTQVYTHIT